MAVALAIAVLAVAWNRGHPAVGVAFGEYSTPALPGRSTTSPVAGQTILVTGGAGFIGSHIVDALLPDNDVRILDNLPTGLRERPPETATATEGDMRDTETSITTVAETIRNHVDP